MRVSILVKKSTICEGVNTQDVIQLSFDVVGQYTIVCLYGDLLGARVNMLIWRIGAGAGICVQTIIWHMCGYFR